MHVKPNVFKYEAEAITFIRNFFETNVYSEVKKEKNSKLIIKKLLLTSYEFFVT